MFSCLLLHSESSTEPLLGKKCDVNVQIVGQTGRGKASASYNLDKDYSDVVLYVPSLISHSGANRQQVTLTKCQMELSASAGQPPSKHAFELAKLDTGEYSTIMRSLPAYLELKKRYKELVLTYCGAHSCEDTLLHLGDLPACQLRLEMEFLLQFVSSSSPCTTQSNLQHLIHNKLPTEKLSYTLSLASPLCIENVTALPPPPSSSPDLLSPHLHSSMLGPNWQHVSTANRNIVHVSYEFSCSIDDHDLEADPCPFSSGFAIELSGDVPSGCCCSVFAQDGATRTTTEVACSSSSSACTDPMPALSSYDGVMMVNNTLTRDQLPMKLQEQPLYPSEFIFVIDCSGSMSGTKIRAAADTLITCVKSLPVGCFFNVIAFGSTFRHLFHDSTEYSKKSVERAVQFANQLSASLGGTELLTPLRWLFKKPHCSGLPRQVLIVTDGGVTNTQAVLHTVRKNRHQARCHTFGIGLDVCVELVTGIAAISGGACVLLAKEERLQTKVMEVLKQSLQPAMTNALLTWHPPAGYTVVDSSPKNPGTIFSGSSHTAFAFLRRRRKEEDVETEKEDTSSTLDGCSSSEEMCVDGGGSCVGVVGLVGGKEVEISVSEVPLPPLSKLQRAELVSILRQGAAWSKLRDLEMQALASSRKNSHDEKTDSLPAAKKPRLNGVSNHITTTVATTTSGKHPDPSIQDEMLGLSLESGVPCAMTYLQSSDNSARKMAQILPYQTQSVTKPTNGHSKMLALQYQQQFAHRRRRRHHNYQSSYHRSRSTHNSVFSIASLAKNTLSTLKSMVGLTTGSADESMENGKRIEDEIEYQENKKLRLFMTESGEIQYPSIYYNSHPSNRSTNHHHSKHTKPAAAAAAAQRTAPQNHKPACNGTTSHCMTAASGDDDTASTAAQRVLVSNGFPTPAVVVQRHIDPSIAGSTAGGGGGGGGGGEEEDDDDFMISDSESDSSVDPDWEDLHRPNELLPLLQMQLFSGAWPMIRAFSYGVGVPLDEIRKLPLRNDEQTQSSSVSAGPSCDGHFVEMDSDEAKASFWTTVLGIVCLEEFFSEFTTEWELVALKARQWLTRNLHQSDVDLTRAFEMAKELALRQS